MSPNSAAQFFIGIGRLWRIVEEAHSGDGLTGKAVKEGLVHAQRESNKTQHIAGQLVNGTIVGHGGLAEFIRIGHLGGPEIGPAVELLVDKVRVVLGDLFANV